jgi:hypothetical protein
MAEGFFSKLKALFGGGSEPIPDAMKTEPGSEMLPAAPAEMDEEDDFRDQGNYRKRNDATPAAIMRR